MKTIWTIIRKELARFFKDRRMLCSLLLPGILIYFVYSFLGTVVVDSLTGVPEDHTYTVCAVNAPDFLTEETLSSIGKVTIETADPSQDETYREQVKNGELDAYLVFPNGFSVLGNGAEKPTVELCLNSLEPASATIGTALNALLASMQYGEPNFYLTAVDFAVEESSGMILSMIAPMLILTLLFTGCLSIAPESIAGEKERGSFATMLVTPVKRSHIAIGKILSLSMVALVSGLSSFIGIILSLPKLMSASGTELGTISFALTDYLLLLAIVLSTVLVMVSIVSLISALAKSVKEATSYVSPLALLGLVAGLLSSLMDGANAWYLYIIPLFNSAAAMNGIFSLTANPLFVLITVVTNLALAFGLGYLLTRMFDSERIMFSK